MSVKKQPKLPKSLPLTRHLKTRLKEGAQLRVESMTLSTDLECLECGLMWECCFSGEPPLLFPCPDCDEIAGQRITEEPTLVEYVKAVLPC
jgi:hypothetical protein